MLAKIQVFWYLMSNHLVTIYQSTEDMNYDKNLVEIVKVSYFSPSPFFGVCVARGGGLKSESSPTLSFSACIFLGVFTLQHQPLCTVCFYHPLKWLVSIFIGKYSKW